MLTEMQIEIAKFFCTFGILILVFILLGRLLSSDLKYIHLPLKDVILDLFKALNGTDDYHNGFKMPVG